MWRMRTSSTIVRIRRGVVRSVGLALTALLVTGCGSGRSTSASRMALHTGSSLAAGGTSLAKRSPAIRVVAPRYLNEYFGTLNAWREALRLRLHAPVSTVWHVQAVRENLTIATLQFMAGTKAASGVGRWAINFPLNRPLSQRETEIAEGENGVVPMDANARRFATFPPAALAPQPAQVELLVGALQVERNHRIYVSFYPRAAVPPGIIARRTVDWGLLAGLRVPGPQALQDPGWLTLSPGVLVQSQPMRSDGSSGVAVRGSLDTLKRRVRSMPGIRLLFAWPRSAAASATRLRRAPVVRVVILQ